VTRLTLKKIKPHVIGWTVFITYEVFLVGSLGNVGVFWDYAIHYCLHIAIFYFHAHVVLPKAFSGNKRNYGTFAAMLLGELSGYILAKYLILYGFYFLHIPIVPPYPGYFLYIVSGLFRAIYFLGLSTGYWFALSTLRKQRQVADLENDNLGKAVENKRLEKMLLATENAYLKSQINPHFLLNTLNFLYNSVSKFSDKIADSVMSLSEITEADGEGKVPLESEIEHIRNFLQLNQSRFNQRLNVSFVAEGDTSKIKIIPLVLITLVENLLKYGDLSNQSSPAEIHLTLVANDLCFVTGNLKKKNARHDSHGIGLQNIRNRLTNYPYSLEITEDERYYKSVLNIRL
jgi:two-component system LytT family sensor kinase